MLKICFATGFLAFLIIFDLPCSAQAQVAAVGASNVAGYGVSSSEAFPAQLQAMLHGYSVTNSGVSGDTTADVLARLDSAVPAGTRIVILGVGGNDIRRGVPPQETRANMAAIAARLHARGIRVINALPLIVSALRAGMAQSDGRHLNVAGHHWVAAKLAAQIR